MDNYCILSYKKQSNQLITLITSHEKCIAFVALFCFCWFFCCCFSSKMVNLSHWCVVTTIWCICCSFTHFFRSFLQFAAKKKRNHQKFMILRANIMNISHPETDPFISIQSNATKTLKKHTEYDIRLNRIDLLCYELWLMTLWIKSRWKAAFKRRTLCNAVISTHFFRVYVCVFGNDSVVFFLLVNGETLFMVMVMTHRHKLTILNVNRNVKYTPHTTKRE